MLCTQLDIEQKLQWDITAEPDTTVTALIADAQALIETEVGRSLESAARTETFDGGRVNIFLRWHPVTAVATVTEDGTALVANDDFRWYHYGKLIRISGNHQSAWRTRKRQSIVVTYTGGYLAGGQPDHNVALEHLGSLCAEVVARAFRKGAANAVIPAGSSGAVQSVSLTGSDTVSYATAGGGTFAQTGGLSQFVSLTDDERSQLVRYKGVSMGFA